LRRPNPPERRDIVVVLELSIFPLDKGGSVSPYVAKALEIIDSSGLEEKLGRTLK
jgi:uncharacterized protein YqgV (UPF0045/DUF77 family)